jgi:hypothetical protein
MRPVLIFRSSYQTSSPVRFWRPLEQLPRFGVARLREEEKYGTGVESADRLADYSYDPANLALCHQ